MSSNTSKVAPQRFSKMMLKPMQKNAKSDESYAARKSLKSALNTYQMRRNASTIMATPPLVDDEDEETLPDIGISSKTLTLAATAIKKQDVMEHVQSMDSSAKFIIHPRSRNLMLWDALIAYLVMMQLFIVPIQIGLFWWEPSPFLKVFNLISDITSVIDMVLQFRTGYFQNSELVTHPKSIAIHYLSSWFVFDALAVFPFHLVVSGMDPSYKISLNFLKYFRLPKMLRIGRLFRVIRKRAKYYGVFVGIMTYTLVLHFLTCTWIAYTVNCHRTPDVCETETIDIWEIYLEALVHTFATMTMNSNLDQWDQSPVFTLTGENRPGLLANKVLPQYRVMYIITVMLGMLCLAMIFGSISSMMEMLNGEGQRFQEKMDRYKKEMEHFGLPASIQNHVAMHFEYLWINKKSFVDMSLLKDPSISRQIRRNISVALYVDIVKAVPFFKHVNDERFVCDICTFLEYNVYMIGDYVFRINDASSDFYMISSGTLCVLNEDDTSNPIAMLGKGDFFGEIGIVEGSRRKNSIRCASIAELCSLSKTHFDDLRNQYPAFEKEMHNVAHRRKEKNNLRSVARILIGAKPTTGAPPEKEATVSRASPQPHDETIVQPFNVVEAEKDPAASPHVRFS